MQYRDVDILASKSVGDAGTETIDLDVMDPITELSILIDLTNGGSALTDDTPTEIVTKIELVDGGTVYSSVTGAQAVAAYFYDAGRYPPHWYDEALSAGQHITIPLRFGRFLGDPLRNFDPSRLRNPQLKVTWAKLSAHLTAYVKLGVRAKILDGVSGAGACLLNQAVRAFTTAGSGIESTELPTDYPIRRLYVHPLYGTEVPPYIITNFKLDCDEGKFIAFDHDGWAMVEEAEKQFGYGQVRRNLIVTTGDNHDTQWGNCIAAMLAAGVQGDIVSGNTSGNRACLCYTMTHAGGAAAAVPTEALFTGCLPEGMFGYGFGLPDDPATWFPAPAYRKVKLLLTQGIASATCTILVQQDRPI